MRSKAISALLMMALVARSAPAWAQGQDSSAAVEALFNEGKKLEAAGHLAEACPKFRASYDLEHRVGTLLNLADCYEKNGQLASAWARFVEARTLASRQNQPERVQFASDHAAALQPKLSKLTVAVPKGTPGLEVKLDGRPMDAGAYGVAVPVDAGKHALEATAPGHTPFTTEVTVGADADQKSVDVPELPLAPTPPQPAPDETSHALGGRRIAAIAVAGAGVIAIGFGAYFGATALGKNSDSSPYCNVGGNKDDCWGPGVSLRNDAVTDATVSTILFGAGAAAVAGGVVLWLTAPSSSGPAPASVGFDGRTLRLTGTF